jgi:hypothetical protein
MKRFDNTKPKFSRLFQLTTLLPRFLHRKKRDLTYEMIGDRLPNLIRHIWVKKI